MKLSTETKIREMKKQKLNSSNKMENDTNLIDITSNIFIRHHRFVIFLLIVLIV